jgi:hypothetical protein
MLLVTKQVTLSFLLVCLVALNNTRTTEYEIDMFNKNCCYTQVVVIIYSFLQDLHAFI